MDSERMSNAIILADKCWNKASKTSPDFVSQYLDLAVKLLEYKPIVLGDEFRENCAANKLYLPASLHHNTWVSGVRALELIGWIRHRGYATPTKGHNHMPQVSLWQSNLFEGNWTVPKQLTLNGFDNFL